MDVGREARDFFATLELNPDVWSIADIEKWLIQHDRRVRAQLLRDLAEKDDIGRYVAHWLRRRADEIEANHGPNILNS